MKTAIAIALTLISMTVVAEEEVAPLQFCTVVSSLAENIMEARQNGVSMVRSMQIASESGEEIKDMVVSLVQMAYDQPRYSTESVKRRAISNFADTAMSGCLKSVGD